MFLTSVEKTIRALRRQIESFGISEELRGYNWDKPPVEPVNDVKIAISDLNGFCPTKRDIFLKYVLKEKAEPNQYMLKGLAVHRIIRETIITLKKAIYSGCDSGEQIINEYFNNSIPYRVCESLDIDCRNICKEFSKLYRYIVLQVAAKVDEVRSKYPDVDAENVVGLILPPVVERKIDGSLIGLSKSLSLDIFTPYNIIIDFKSGYERFEHMLSLSGYALALEADDEVDVNFGLLIYIKTGERVQFNQKAFLIGDELRREFLEVRDEIAELIESGSDPGKPPECPRYCCYYGVCNEGSC
ncbi:MAG: type I-A CRISPR-associated protein Cas4/Csa1 [Archaeoglobus sp.]|nr:MAG: type I-A CRISPR-associated protein Cas4/Csa1 [Archaeoglobus sp.]